MGIERILLVCIGLLICGCVQINPEKVITTVESASMATVAVDDASTTEDTRGPCGLGPVKLQPDNQPKKATPTMDKTTYAQGELIRFVAESQTQLYDVTCCDSLGLGYRIFKLNGTEQEELYFNYFTGQDKSFEVECFYEEQSSDEGNLIGLMECDIISCQPMNQDYHFDLKWDQSEYVTLNETCGQNKQVPPGRYKVIYSYFTDSNCTTLERVEREFEIK